MEIFLEELQEPAARSDTKKVSVILLKHCRIFQSPVHELLDHRKQSDCNVKMKMSPILTNLPFSVHRALWQGISV